MLLLPLRGIDTEVPRSPGAACPGHHRVIGMEECRVALVPKGGEEASLFFRGAAEHREALVGMGGHDDGIKALPRSRGGRHPGPIGIFRDQGYRITESWLAEHREYFFHIAAGATIHGEPWMVGGDAEEAMVVEKMEQGGGRKIEDATRLRRPDGGTHRDQVEIDEVGAEAVTPAESGEILLGNLVTVRE